MRELEIISVNGVQYAVTDEKGGIGDTIAVFSVGIDGVGKGYDTYYITTDSDKSRLLRACEGTKKVIGIIKSEPLPIQRNVIYTFTLLDDNRYEVYSNMFERLSCYSVEDTLEDAIREYDKNRIDFQKFIKTKIKNNMANLIPPEHIGNGLYVMDNGYYVVIAVNHHKNAVAYIDINDIDRAIDYLTRVKKRLKGK